MVFSSLTFLFCFLPLLILCYFLVPKRLIKCRRYVLLVFSIIFYTSGEPTYIIVIFICIFITWGVSARIEDGDTMCLILALLLSVLPLVFFKYSGFIIENITAITGADWLRAPNISLPIGISFYTFQMLSYIVDLYYGKISRQKNIGLFALYIMFFPQMIAGPIVRYQDIEYSLETCNESWKKIKIGSGRFILGLTKKVVIANQVGYISSTITKYSIESLSSGLVWLSVFAYTMQIYFDFSGYSDMAIGLGNIFGFNFPENFKLPYSAISIKDFWRKWHITLGSFFRDYIYIPMGGNRVSIGRWIINVMVVWCLTGLWHGASWNFVIWGMYWGILLILEEILFVRIVEKMPTVLSWALTFVFIMLGWSIFMCDGYSISEMVGFIGRLFNAKVIINPVTIGAMGLWEYIPYLFLAFVISSPIVMGIFRFYVKIKEKQYKWFPVLNDIFLMGLMVLNIIFIIGSSYNPFIYYKF